MADQVLQSLPLVSVTNIVKVGKLTELELTFYNSENGEIFIEYFTICWTKLFKTINAV